MFRFDFHTHSTFSDGALTPTELVQAAADAHIDFLALTDHDSVSGIAEARQAAKALENAPQIVEGVEISTNHTLANNKRGMSVHIVGLGFADIEGMHHNLQKIQQQRETRAIKICEKLVPLLDQDIYPEVLKLAKDNPKAVTRSHIAKAMVELGLVAKYQHAFDKYLSDRKPAYVPIDTVGIAEAIGMIHAAGGKAVLAHPTRYQLSATKTRQLIAEFARLGGDAVELPPRNESPATRAMVDRCIAQHGLAVSVSSDFHGDHMPWLKLGHVPVKLPEQQGVWEAFLDVAQLESAPNNPQEAIV